MKPHIALFVAFAISTLPLTARAQVLSNDRPVYPAVAIEPPSKDGFNPKRNAAKDLAEAVSLADKKHKRILVDVGGEWCIWCKKLDRLFKSDKDIMKVLADKYVIVKVNYSPENENKAVLGKFPAIEGYPHLFVLGKAGKLLWSEDTSLLEAGDHHDPAKVLAFLKKWSP